MNASLVGVRLGALVQQLVASFGIRVHSPPAWLVSSTGTARCLGAGQQCDDHAVEVDEEADQVEEDPEDGELGVASQVPVVVDGDRVVHADAAGRDVLVPAGRWWIEAKETVSLAFSQIVETSTVMNRHPHPLQQHPPRSLSNFPHLPGVVSVMSRCRIERTG